MNGSVEIRAKRGLLARFAEIFAIAAAYAISGRLGLLLAIPPGYATAIFPPAGIALGTMLVLGYRTWPGVWLGSFLMNLAVSLASASGFSPPTSIGLPAIIGTGAALQALTGTYLVRRYIGFPNPLDTHSDVFKFLTLGGLVSCLVNPSLGVTALAWSGIVGPERRFFNWWTWWVGDAIGVLIVCPLVLIWGAEPRRIWLRRKFTVALPLCAGFALTTILFVYASHWQERNLRLEFEQRAAELGSSIERKFDAKDYVIGGSHFNALIRAAIADKRMSGLEISIRDINDSAVHPVLHSSGSEPVVDKSGRLGLNFLGASLAWKTELNLAGHPVVLQVLSNDKYLPANRPLSAWLVMAGGLVFVGLLGAFLLVGTGRSAVVEALVTERTRELLRANRALERQSTELQKSREELEARVSERTAELTKLNQELGRSNADLEHFAFVASHDLKEPLRVIRNYVQLLEQRYRDKLDADALEFIGFASDGASRMSSLIEDLLTYARVGTRHEEFKLTDCNVVLEATIKDMDIGIREARAEIAFGSLPTIFGDATQIQQLFQNLISNAIKFHGDNAPKVEIGATLRKEGWVFSFRDNGIGIEPHFFERLFLLFERSHSRSEYPGTGIGLAVCKKIVERHGGKIWAESEEGRGSTFFFTLMPREATNRG